VKTSVTSRFCDEAQVAELDLTIDHQHVGGFHVAMDQALGVEVLESAEDLGGDVQCPGGGHRRLALDQRGERERAIRTTGILPVL
jgi:hypothetical protein